MLFVKNKINLSQFYKFILLGLFKTLINNLIYIILVKVGISMYVAFTVASLLVLILTFVINKKFIFASDSLKKNYVYFLKYTFIFISYILISYLILYLLTLTTIRVDLYSVVVSLTLLLPNYHATRFIFK